MKKTTALALLLFNFLPFLISQKPGGIIQRQPPRPTTFQPKLVVGIVVDQMRFDYLYRFREKYGEGGFKRLLREGFSCENTNFNYTPTFTGPGHAAIYTGTTPSLNGVISNEWYDPQWGKMRYVTADTTVRSVGAPNGKSGQQSPRVLLSTTVTDELRLSNNFQSKVVGICLKDRGSILPAGHIPNACFWFDDGTGNWITSSFYPDSIDLPVWVKNFNDRQLPEKYLSGNWSPQLPENQYTESFQGWEKYEKQFSKTASGRFPHDLVADKKSFTGVGIIRYTPFGNTLTTDFALEAIEKMDLGADAVPDFLALSFSSTDYCAHQFGIHSEETEDVYLRFDLEIERILTFLDKKIGKENVLVFLTADHGGGETPVHLQEIGIPAGVLEESKLEKTLNDLLGKSFGQQGKFIHEVGSQQIWLNDAEFERSNIDKLVAEALIISYLKKLPGIYDAHTRAGLMALPADYPFISEVRRGIFPRRSGDIFFQLDPAWHPDDRWFKTTGATHGSQYAYDTHVPLIWYGWKIRHGETFAPIKITDIAPTISALLHIAKPNATTGDVILEIVK